MDRKERNKAIKQAKALRAEGLTYEKIGKQLGVSDATLSRWLSGNVRMRRKKKSVARKPKTEAQLKLNIIESVLNLNLDPKKRIDLALLVIQ